MNLAELRDLTLASTDVLRVETLDAYSSASDTDMLTRFMRGDAKPDPSEKRDWLDHLAASAQRGHRWKRLRVVKRPVTAYLRYSCEWGYVDNVAAGEDVRVLDTAHSPADAWRIARFGDFWVLDGELVATQYVDGAFVSAQRARDGDITAEGAAAIVQDASISFAFAPAFAEWWAANPDLHRTRDGR